MKASPDKARKLLKQHFGKITSEEFETNLREHSPEIFEKAVAKREGLLEGKFDAEQQVFVFPTPPSPLPLSAYIATALTGLSEEAKELIIHLSDVVADICREVDIDPYQPHRHTDPVYHKGMHSAEQIYEIDNKNVLESDLLVHLCQYPSTGSGQELAFAHEALLPIVLIIHADKEASMMIRGMPSFKIEVMYKELDDLKVELRHRLNEIRPLLEERKLAFAEFNKNLVGNRIRELREELGLTRKEVAEAIGLTVPGLRKIEENPDRVSNPTLLQLRQLATILRTTVADLVEPHMGERLIGMLGEFLRTRNAARFGVSEKDMRLLLRRFLRRVIDEIDI